MCGGKRFLQGWFIPLGILLGAAAGCGPSGDGRVPLAGEVTLDGEPLGHGSIELHPEGEGLVVTGGMIQGGRFDIPVTQGPKPGNYLVRVYSAGDPVEPDPDEAPGPEAVDKISEERIPAKYNKETELKLVVGDRGQRDVRFELSSS